MFNATLNEVIITTEIPIELLKKLYILEEYKWQTIDNIPKLKLLPDEKAFVNIDYSLPTPRGKRSNPT